jgi:hypothetical protein
MVGSPPPPSSGIPRPFVTTIKIKEFGIANGIDVAPPPTTNLLTARPQGNGGPVNNGAVSRNSRSQRMSNGGGSNYATATTSFGMMMPSNGSSDSVDSASALTSATTKLPVYNGTKKVRVSFRLIFCHFFPILDSKNDSILANSPAYATSSRRP